ncbi:hypothetical protein [Sideroxydans sp.]
MVTKTEKERICERTGLAILPTPSWEFEVDVGSQTAEFEGRIRSVVAEIAKHQPHQWPADDYWKAELPSWLVESMPELSQEDCVKLMNATPRDKWSTLPWQFDSWLDAIRERGWEWWGYEFIGQKMRIVLYITSIPPRVEAFKQILQAAGARGIHQSEKINESK